MSVPAHAIADGPTSPKTVTVTEEFAGRPATSASTDARSKSAFSRAPTIRAPSAAAHPLKGALPTQSLTLEMFVKICQEATDINFTYTKDIVPFVEKLLAE